jgi:hypothetical protein
MYRNVSKSKSVEFHFITFYPGLSRDKQTVNRLVLSSTLKCSALPAQIAIAAVFDAIQVSFSFRALGV